MMAVLLIDKIMGMKAERKVVAEKGDIVTVYNTSHDPVYLCVTKRGFTFPMNIEYLKIQSNDIT